MCSAGVLQQRFLLLCLQQTRSCCSVCNSSACTRNSSASYLRVSATRAPPSQLHYVLTYLCNCSINREYTHTHTHTGAWLLGARGAPRLPPPLLRPFRCLLIPARLLRVRIRSSRCWLTASAISPPVSVSLLPLLPYVCASFSLLACLEPRLACLH